MRGSLPYLWDPSSLVPLLLYSIPHSRITRKKKIFLSISFCSSSSSSYFSGIREVESSHFLTSPLLSRCGPSLPMKLLVFSSFLPLLLALAGLLTPCRGEPGLGAKRIAALPFHSKPSPDFCSKYPQFRVASSSSYPSFQMLIYSGQDVVSQTMAFHRNYELFNSYFMTHILNILEGSVLVDFGANLGWFSLLAASKGHSTISIEAIPCNHYAVAESVKLNHFEKLIKLHNKALASTKSASTLCLDDTAADNHNMGNSMLQMNVLTARKEKCSPSFLVPVAPLDSLIPNNTHVGFMKADCEGCEASVLLASKSLFFSSSAPCAVMIEWYLPLTNRFEGKNAEQEMLAVGEMLLQAGYVFVDFIMGTHGLRPVDVQKEKYRNFFDGKVQRELKAVLTTDRCFPRKSDKWVRLFSTI